MIYANGVKLNISDIVRITFVDSYDGNIKTVAEVAMQVEVLKQLRDGITNCIEEHEAKLDKMAKSN
jgi:hypothetical protein